MDKLTNLDKYKAVVWAYRNLAAKSRTTFSHIHHIKPKSLYPELADSKDNLVKVPGIVHWALHEWLLAWYKESGNEKAVSKLKFADVATFLNQQLKAAGKCRFFDFERRKEMLEYIYIAVVECHEQKRRQKNAQEKYYLDMAQFVAGIKASGRELSAKCMTKDEISRKESIWDAYRGVLCDYNASRKRLFCMNNVILELYGVDSTDELECFTDEEACAVLEKSVESTLGCDSVMFYFELPEKHEFKALTTISKQRLAEFAKTIASVDLPNPV